MVLEAIHSDIQMLEIRMLGQFSLRLDGKPVTIKSRPAQSLLAYLVLNSGKPHRREKLAGIFWPDATESNARSNLRHALWRVRKALGEQKVGESDYIQVDSFTIEYSANHDQWVDAYRLQEGVQKEPSLDELIEDVSVYGGELLPGFYEDWVVLERERLRAVLDDKMQSLLDRCVIEERWRDAMEWGERWIALGHVPEPAYRAIMIAQHGLGDISGVAATYLRCRLALEEEVGVEPSELTESTYLWLTEGGPRPDALPNQISQKYVASQSSSAIAADSLLNQWRAQNRDVLDVASLALINRAGDEFNIRDEDAPLLIRSALLYDVDVDPWVNRLSSPEVAVAALAESYESADDSRVRKRIVDSLLGLSCPDADEMLIAIAMSDDAPQVREIAAVEAARRGHCKTLSMALAEELNQGASPAALAAFVAVADEIGLPDDVGPYPELMVQLTLAQRRWRSMRRAVSSQTMWSAIYGGAGMAVVGALSPLFVAIADSEVFQSNLDIFSLAAWAFSGALAGIVFGAIHGAAIGLSVGLADTMSPLSKYWHVLAGAFGGLVYSFRYIGFAAMGLQAPEVSSQVYIPMVVIAGLLTGAAISLIIPRLGSVAPVKHQSRQLVVTAILLAFILLGFDWVVYPDTNIYAFLADYVTFVVLALALAIGLSDRNQRFHQISDRERLIEIEPEPNHN